MCERDCEGMGVCTRERERVRESERAFEIIWKLN